MPKALCPFWGVGGNTPESAIERYNMETFSVRAVLLDRIPPYLNFGFEYQFEYHKMLEVLEGGFSSKTFGASYSYNRYLIDLQKGGYVNLARTIYPGTAGVLMLCKYLPISSGHFVMGKSPKDYSIEKSIGWMGKEEDLIMLKD